MSLLSLLSRQTRVTVSIRPSRCRNRSPSRLHPSMDADMDIPLPEELEWLEANSYLHEDLEDYEDQEPREPYPEEEEEELQEPPSSLSPTPINGQKRPLSDSRDAPNSGKRSKADLAETGAEEDWLRYSPPQETILEPMVVDEVNIVSRYASEIDGDCVPVTGPGGDRVYLKISATGSEERSRKVELQGHAKGESRFTVVVWLPRE